MQLTREPRAGGAARAIAPVTVAGEPIGALAVLAEPPAVHAPSATLRALQAHEKLLRVVTGARSWLRSEQSTQQDSAPPSALPAEVAARSRLAQLFQSAPVLPFVERPTAAELGGIWMRMHLDQLTGDDLKRVMGSIRATNAAYAEAPCNGGRSMREAMLAHFGLALSVQPTATFLDGAAEMLEHSVAPWEPEITQAMAFRGDLNAVRVVPRALIPSGQAIEAAFAAFERTDAPTGAEISAALGVQPSGPLANLAAALVPLADRHFLHEHELIDVLAPTFTVPPFDPNANPAEPIRRAITAAVGRAARAKTPARFVVGELDGAPVELVVTAAPRRYYDPPETFLGLVQLLLPDQPAPGLIAVEMYARTMIDGANTMFLSGGALHPFAFNFHNANCAPFVMRRIHDGTWTSSLYVDCPTGFLHRLDASLR